MFDECVPRGAFEQLRTEYSGYEFGHITKKYGEAVLDRIWVPEIRDEKRWCVVSADRGKGDDSPDDELPRLCWNHGVTHFLLTSRIHHYRMPIKTDCLRWLFIDYIMPIAIENKAGGWILDAKTNEKKKKWITSAEELTYQLAPTNLLPSSTRS